MINLNKSALEILLKSFYKGSKIMDLAPNSNEGEESGRRQNFQFFVESNNYTEILATEKLKKIQINPMGIATIANMIIYSVIILVGLVGNLTVILAIIRYTKMKTVTNIYLLNLSFADILFLMVLPVWLIQLPTGWTFGDAVCKIYWCACTTNQFGSSLFITVLSIDRWIAVCHPNMGRKLRKPCHSGAVCVGVWIVSGITVLPVTLFAIVRKEGNMVVCTPDPVRMPAKEFTLYGFILAFAIPLPLISFMYAQIIKKLTIPKSRQQLLSKQAFRIRRESKRRISRMVLIVIGCYVASWLPYWMLNILQVFLTDFNFHQAVWLIIYILAYASNAINPIIYIFMNPTFKEIVARLLCQCCTRLKGKNMDAEPDRANSPPAASSDNRATPSKFSPSPSSFWGRTSETTSVTPAVKHGRGGKRKKGDRKRQLLPHHRRELEISMQELGKRPKKFGPFLELPEETYGGGGKTKGTKVVEVEVTSSFITPTGRRQELSTSVSTKFTSGSLSTKNLLTNTDATTTSRTETDLTDPGEVGIPIVGNRIRPRVETDGTATTFMSTTTASSADDRAVIVHVSRPEDYLSVFDGESYDEDDDYDYNDDVIHETEEDEEEESESEDEERALTQCSGTLDGVEDDERESLTVVQAENNGNNGI